MAREHVSLDSGCAKRKEAERVGSSSLRSPTLNPKRRFRVYGFGFGCRGLFRASPKP